MSDDVKELASAVAEELAAEHCSFYGDKTSKAVKGFFLNQLYRTWRHTAHRGWARLFLDRRSLVQVPNAPPRRTRADDSHYEENITGSYFYPGVPVLTLISTSTTKKTIWNLYSGYIK